MNFFTAIRIALAALLVHKGRSALTSLGIVLGTGAVIAIVSAGAGARRKLDERLDSVGKNLILIRPGARTQQGSVADFAPLTQEDADALREQVGPFVTGIAETQLTQRVASGPGGNWPTAVVGCTPELQAVRQWPVVAGRFLSGDDLKKQAPVCLIGATVRRKLFAGADPVGRRLRVDRLSLRVVGVLAAKGRSPTGNDQDDQVLVPITTLQKQLAGDERLSLILTAPRSEGMTDRVKAEITRVLRERHRVKPGAEDFDVSSVNEMAELARVVTLTLQGLVAVIASIALVVGGIGIMNIMLVSVTERTREIGLRLAVGATPAEVRAQFLIEAVVLALLGGVLGVALGLGAAVLLARAAGWPVIVSPSAVLAACGVSAAVGVLFGYYPARRAARLDPIEALRCD